MPLRAFIVRPFGVKKDSAGSEIDFERVERELIDPALARLGIEGRTTAEITEAGNIREDMFQLLATADLVVADVSVHNANVFYELGVRHSLRDKRTFMIRCLTADKPPFDLQTDRYLVYDRLEPAKTLADLFESLRQTIASERRDSPIFLMLPELKAQDPGRFLIVPPDFGEDVERAAAGGQVGDLALFTTEVQGLPWGGEGLRVLGRTLRRLKAFEEARVAWEAIRDAASDDIEANLQLGTINERLGRLPDSDVALKRVLSNPDVNASDRAEAYALKARNLKTHWQNEWREAPQDQQRQRALRSGYLAQCSEAYERGYREDLNSFYPGLNAAGMLTITAQLAEALPEAWASMQDYAEEAPVNLAKLKRRLEALCRSVELSLQAASERLQRQNRSDIWLEISRADLVCLTSVNPGRVGAAYEKALAGAGAFERESAGKQLALYEQLGILSQNVRSALDVVNFRATKKEELRKTRILLFTGHRIDAPDRPAPRFPADKEPAARQAIQNAVAGEVQLSPGCMIRGIAGGASGGDILFQEVLREMNIPSEMYLALPPQQYVTESVQAAGPEWVERFNRLCAVLPQRVLAESKELPRWLRRKKDYGVWQRSNLWMLHNAPASPLVNVTLIALWDGKGGDGPGGTEDMVRQARQRGAKVIVLAPPT